MQQDNNVKQKQINELGILFIIVVLATLVTAILSNILATKNIQMPAILGIVLGEGVIMIPGLIYIVYKKYSFVEQLGFRKIKVSTFFMTVLIAFLTMPIASFINVLTQFFVKNTLVQASGSLTSNSSSVVLLIAGIVGPICEELIFRGLYFERIKAVSRPFIAALLSAVFFGLMHLNVNQTCYAFVLGLIFAIVNQASGSVYTSIIVHIVVNTVNVLMLLVANAAYDNMGMDMTEAVEDVRTSSMIYYTAAVYMVLAIICVAILVPCIAAIAKFQGRTDELKLMFKRAEKSESEDVKVFANIPVIVGIVLCVAIIFGLDPLIRMMGM